MKAGKATDVEAAVVPSIPYRGRDQAVKGVDIRWLSKADLDGQPGYGLRLFTVRPGGEIPIHSHPYHQTIYVLSGQFECWAFDPETDALTGKALCGPGDTVYVPSMEPHGMKNASDSEEGSFLCCICTLSSG